MAVAEAAPSRACTDRSRSRFVTHGTLRSTKTFTTIATSRSPSCFVVTLTVHPSLMSSKATASCANPGFPGSLERRERTIFDSARISIGTTRGRPVAGASTVSVLPTTSTAFTVPAIGASSAAAGPTDASRNKTITRCRMAPSESERQAGREEKAIAVCRPREFSPDTRVPYPA